MGFMSASRDITVKVASIVLCAGIGSRLKSAQSKILHEVCGRAMGYWPIKNALECTTTKPIVVVSHQAEKVEDKLSSYFYDGITIAKQKLPDGTGGAVKAAIPYLDPECESVLVICGDTVLLRKESLAKLITIQRKSHVPIALLSAYAPDPAGYGRIIRNQAQELVRIVEDRDASMVEKEIKEVNTGVYVFDAEFLRNNINNLTNRNAKHEYYLTDLIEQYINTGAKMGPVESVEVPYEEMFGINDRSQLAHAQQVMNQRLLHQWMLDGVTVIDPASTYVEVSVRLSKDVVIYPGVHLRGETHIGEGSIIENGSIITDTVIEKNAHVFPYSCCSQAYIGERSQVGPFARLRPDARLENDVKVGNFVEIKRSRLKSGTKANHLAYIGDAEIGENCNIGAGAITCNYDGYDKHRTVIGEAVFIGSNATLIAPLAIGNGSYVAGGSVVNEEVPNNTLAIGRAYQVNKSHKLNSKKKISQLVKLSDTNPVN